MHDGISDDHTGYSLIQYCPMQGTAVQGDSTTFFSIESLGRIQKAVNQKAPNISLASLKLKSVESHEHNEDISVWYGREGYGVSALMHWHFE